MRTHGRLVKNIAGLLLLLALLSLLLPFCKFNAGAGDMTLSGVEVLKTGGKAGYIYFKTGALSDDYILKSPYTWGDIKQSVLYINNAGGAKIMVFCGAAIVIPIILCFLSMIMLFMAEGKKTMFLPTVFTFATSAEMVLVLLLFSQLRPFLMVGVYLFTLLNVFALIFILAGWLTGGYSQPDRRLGRYGNDNDKSSDDDNDGSRRKRTKRKTRRKKKTKKKADKGETAIMKKNKEETTEKVTETATEKVTKKVETTTKKAKKVVKKSSKKATKAKSNSNGKSAAKKYIGKNMDELVAAIGKYKSMDKDKSCLEEGEYDGFFYYDGFTVSATTKNGQWIINSVD